ncbi:putative uncharacterized protein DDB_G0268364 [Osmia bicornis bicornis]|uniref:putative uncharacterized protein DDB_G0268364 n=1 Tax=Osmia bicornis bicornis TaxID=1437191 RepID=UPI001EAF6387|nr:putative uncharacterized protein DDB_G0268364 [Osmia bicornis bicornis]
MQQMNNLLQKIQQQQQEQQQQEQQQYAQYIPHPVPHPQPYQPHVSQLNELYEPEEQNSYRAKQALIREYSRRKMKKLRRETAPWPSRGRGNGNGGGRGNGNEGGRGRGCSGRNIAFYF